MTFTSCRAAGVTFTNEKPDGTKVDRQKILKERLQESPFITLWPTPCKFFNEETKQWEDACRLIEAVSGETIGFLPKEKAHAADGVKRLVGEIHEFKGTAGVVLRLPEAVDNILYWRVRRFCEKHGMERPSHDGAAYRYFFNRYMRGGNVCSPAR